MDFDLSADEQAFVAEIRQFLAEELTDEIRGNPLTVVLIDTPARQEFVTKMADRGWLGMGFPEEYGGSKQPMALAQYLLNHELDMAGAPNIGKNIGIIGNTLLQNGSEVLKQDFLPKIFRNEVQWALAYTEPDAGSDLASLRCSAEEFKDHFVVNGTKRFITAAHFADQLWTAVRTDPTAGSVYDGISLLIIDADSPGITVTPMYTVGTGVTERTNEVVFNEVEVPITQLVGEKNRGWYYMMEALDRERLGTTSFTPIERHFENLLRWIKAGATIGDEKIAEDPIVREKIANMAIQIEVGRMLQTNCICAAMNYPPNIEAAMLKAWGGIVWSELANLILDIMGPFGFLSTGSPEAPMGGEMVDLYLMSGHHRVAAGGVDIAKSIVARRLLGLPNTHSRKNGFG